MVFPEIAYATDEDLAIRAGSDIPLLCQPDQRIATGTDGVILATDRWSLRSASVSFSGQGVEPGQLVQLLAPSGQYTPPGDLLLVHGVGPYQVELRRKGLAPRLGQPPGDEGGSGGLRFEVFTFRPQIAEATRLVNRHYRIDSAEPGRAPTDLADPGQLRELVTLTVLAGLYASASARPAASGDVFAVRARQFEVEREAAQRMVSLRWRSESGRSSVTTSMMSMRITRG